MARWFGSILALSIVSGVAVILLLNLERKPALAPNSLARQREANAPATQSGSPRVSPPQTIANAPFREYSVGDEIVREQEHIGIDAKYFAAVPMDGMPAPTDEDALHIEADIRATANNPHGFARGQFIPYLKITYTIEPVRGGERLTGTLVPMVARDGLHYGATVLMPGPGQCKLTYRLEPPSAGGLGRHDDAITGVALWWEPFEVTWDWNYERPEKLAGLPNSDSK